MNISPIEPLTFYNSTLVFMIFTVAQATTFILTVRKFQPRVKYRYYCFKVVFFFFFFSSSKDGLLGVIIFILIPFIVSWLKFDSVHRRKFSIQKPQFLNKHKPLSANASIIMFRTMARLNIPEEVSSSATQRIASLYSQAIHLSTLRAIKLSQASSSPSTFTHATSSPSSRSSSSPSDDYDGQHLACSKELSELITSGGPSSAVYALFWHPSIPASGIDAALGLFRRAASLIPESYTENYSGEKSHSGKHVALHRLADFLHRELELDAFPRIDQDSSLSSATFSLKEQLERNKAYNENIRHRALWGRIYSADLGVLPIDYVKHVVYLTVGFLDYAFRTKAPDDDDSKWVENEFIGGCIMFRGMAKSLKGALATGDPEEDYSGRIEKWEDGIRKIIDENKGDGEGGSSRKVWIHAQLVLENIKQGCRDESSEELFDERVWIY